MDINGIESLRGLREDQGWLRMGALCRHADVLASPLVAARLPLMIDSASQTADVQVRNRGTMGGSLVHADPAADWPSAPCSSAPWAPRASDAPPRAACTCSAARW